MRAMTERRYILTTATPADVEAAVAIDDAACLRYRDVGIDLDFDADHPMVVDERAAWSAGAAAGRLFFAIGEDADTRLGFVAMGIKDGCAFLEQISVLPDFMGRGVGGFLMDEAIAWSRNHGGGALWLTTYDHVPWNRPWYERRGFRVVPEEDWGPDIASTIAFQRACLPDPDARVAMRKAL